MRKCPEGLTPPKCLNPDCNNLVRWGGGQRWPRTCGHSCQILLRNRGITKKDLPERPIVIPKCINEGCNKLVRSIRKGGLNKFCSMNCAHEHLRKTVGPPKCANPKCENLVSHFDGYEWRTYCSVTCSTTHRWTNEDFRSVIIEGMSVRRLGRKMPPYVRGPRLESAKRAQSETMKLKFKLDINFKERHRAGCKRI